MTGPLDGVRVLEAASGVGGPYCGKLLAGLGADVVKIERPAVGDVTRSLPPRLPSADPLDGSALFHHLNTGKRSVCLDLTEADGRGRFDQLLHRWCDVLITSYSAARLMELGLTYPELRFKNPALVAVSVTDFGLTGPYANYAESEPAALAIGGYLNLTGEPRREPVKPWGNQAQFHAGLHAATGAVGAILTAEACGEGDQVDASTVEAASFLSSAAPGWSYFYKEEPSRVGNRLANLDPKQFYPSTMRPCRDGWVHAHGNVQDQSRLEVLMGDPELSRPDILAEPKGHADELDAIMDRWLANYTRAEVVEMAQTLRIPFTEVFTPAEVIEDAHLNGRQTFVELDHPSIGLAKYPHAPIKFHATPWTTDRAPRLGEHTESFLSEALGLTAAELRRLTSAAGVN